MRTQLVICNEEDYLQAHLTFIQADSRGRSLTLHRVKARLVAVFGGLRFGKKTVRMPAPSATSWRAKRN